MATLFGLTKTVVIQKIKKYPEETKEALRGLSLGPVDGTMWRWTYHDGSTWAAVMHTGSLPKISGDSVSSQSPEGVSQSGSESKPPDNQPIAWACLTKQEEPHPVLGVYVHPDYRGYGLAHELVTHLLKALLSTGCLCQGDTVIAVSERFRDYPRILNGLGLVHSEWD